MIIPWSAGDQAVAFNLQVKSVYSASGLNALTSVLLCFYLLASLYVVAPSGTLLAPDMMPLRAHLSREFQSPEAVRKAHPVAWWVARDYFAMKPKMVIFGNSQLGGLRASDAQTAGRDLDFTLDHRCYTLEKLLNDNRKVFVASQPGTLVSDYFAMVASLIGRRDRPVPDLAILCLAPRDFMGNGLPYPGDSQYFRFLCPYIDCSNHAWYELAYAGAFARYHAHLKTLIGDRIPMLKPGKFIFLKEDGQTFHDVPLGYEQARSPGEAGEIERQLAFLRQTYLYLHKQGVRTLTVLLPIFQPSKYEMQLTRTIDCKIERIRASLPSGPGKPAGPYGAGRQSDYLNLSLEQSFQSQPNYFLDRAHLSQVGGQRFAKILAEYINQANLNSKMP